MQHVVSVERRPIWTIYIQAAMFPYNKGSTDGSRDRRSEETQLRDRKTTTDNICQSGTEAEKKPSIVHQGLLSAANDWSLEVDLFNKLKLPRNITTNIRPDALLWYKKTSQVILFELQFLREVGCKRPTKHMYEKMLLKCQQLVQQCIEAGWRSWCVPVEVGVKGFPGNSL